MVQLFCKLVDKLGIVLINILVNTTVNCAFRLSFRRGTNTYHITDDKLKILDNVVYRIELLKSDVQEQNDTTLRLLFNEETPNVCGIGNNALMCVLGTKELVDWFWEVINSIMSETANLNLLTMYSKYNEERYIRQIFKIVDLFKQPREDKFKIFKLLIWDKISIKNMKIIVELMAEDNKTLIKKNKEKETIIWMISEIRLYKIWMEMEIAETMRELDKIGCYNNTIICGVNMINNKARKYTNRRYYDKRIKHVLFMDCKKTLYMKYKYTEKTLRIKKIKKQANIMMESKFIINLILYIHGKMRISFCNTHKHENADQANQYWDLLSCIPNRLNVWRSRPSRCKYNSEHFISLEVFLKLVSFLPWKETKKIITPEEKEKLRNILRSVLCCLGFTKYDYGDFHGLYWQYSEIVMRIMSGSGFYSQNPCREGECWFHLGSKVVDKLEERGVSFIQTFWMSVGNLLYILEDCKKICISITMPSEEQRITIRNCRIILFENYLVWNLHNAEEISLGEVVSSYGKLIYISIRCIYLGPSLQDGPTRSNPVCANDAQQNIYMGESANFFKLSPPGVSKQRLL